jgi:hypothetical protein
LCHYTLEPNGGDQDAPERLTLAFSTADVVIVSARLGKPVELINEHDLGSVSAADARYVNLLVRAPWVASIAIARLDKSGGAAVEALRKPMGAAGSPPGCDMAGLDNVSVSERGPARV